MMKLTVEETEQVYEEPKPHRLHTMNGADVFIEALKKIG